jgi:hypothetical protein
MIPRLASPRFGLLDDATSIFNSQQILHGDLSSVQGLNSGRFKPSFFLVFTLYYAIAGMNPLVYFIIDTVVVILITCGLIFLIHRQSQNKMIAWWSGTLFVLSSPIIENFYTVYKQEPLQILLIMGAIFTTGQIKKGSSLRRIVTLSSLGIILTLTLVSLKETSLIIIPIAVSWYFGALALKKITKQETEEFGKRTFMIVTLCSGLLFIIFWYMTKHSVIAVDIIHSGYSFIPSNILHSLREWERWIRRDFFFIYFLAIPPFLWSIREKRLPHGILLFDTLIWMIGWLVVFIPWEYQLDYYLLPFALGSSVIGAICIHQINTIFKNGSLYYRVISIISLCLAGFFFLTTLPNNLMNARLQLTVDKRDMDFVSFVSDELPENVTLLINIQQPSEYLVTIPRFVNVHYDRSDIQIRQLKVDDLGFAEIDNEHYYIATPILENQFYRSIRLGFSADGTRKWNKSITAYLDGKEELVFESLGTFRLFLVEIRLGCIFRNVPGYCDIPNIPLDRRELTYGWRVYRVSIQY